MRDTTLVIASVMVLVGLVAIVALELGSRDRRIVGRTRDAVEVLLPPVLTAVLVGTIWSSHGFFG